MRLSAAPLLINMSIEVLVGLERVPALFASNFSHYLPIGLAIVHHAIVQHAVVHTVVHTCLHFRLLHISTAFSVLIHQIV